MKIIKSYVNKLGFEDRAEGARFALMALFVFSLPYDMIYSSLILITLALSTLISINREKLRRIPKQIYIFQVVYLLGLASYLYSYNRASANYLLERQLSILLFPFIIPLAIVPSRQKTECLLATLTISSLLAALYLFISLALTIKYELELPIMSSAFSGAFFNHQFSRPLQIHAGYLSLYFAFSIIYLVQLYSASIGRSLKLLVVPALLLLSGALFFLASRNTIIAMFFILVFIFPLFKIKNKLRYISISLASVIVSFVLFNKVPYLRERFFTELITDINPDVGSAVINYNSAEPRFDRWKGALELIKRSPLIGYGTGDEILMLKTEYIKRGLFISYLEEFNAHNQYLSYLLKSGIIGLLVFLGAFACYFYYAIQTRDYMYVSFLLFLVFGFYTENILDANKGIFFFAFFNTFFGCHALSVYKNKL